MAWNYCTNRRGDSNIYEWKRTGAAKGRPAINCGPCDRIYIWDYIYARHSSRTPDGRWNYSAIIKDCYSTVQNVSKITLNVICVPQDRQQMPVFPHPSHMQYEVH